MESNKDEISSRLIKESWPNQKSQNQEVLHTSAELKSILRKTEMGPRLGSKHVSFDAATLALPLKPYRKHLPQRRVSPDKQQKNMQAETQDFFSLALLGNLKRIKILINLKGSPHDDFILTRVSGKEECGRKWNTCSLAYAFWAGDLKTVRFLLKSLSATKQQDALLAINEIQKLIPLDPYFQLLKVYKDFISNFKNWGSLERNLYWIKVVGGQQRRLPTVGLQWICNKNYFSKGIQSFGEERSLLVNGLFRQRPLPNSYLLPIKTSGLGETYALNHSESDILWGASAEACVNSPSLLQLQKMTDSLESFCSDTATEMAEIIEQLESHTSNTPCSIS